MYQKRRLKFGELCRGFRFPWPFSHARPSMTCIGTSLRSQPFCQAKVLFCLAILRMSGTSYSFDPRYFAIIFRVCSIHRSTRGQNQNGSGGCQGSRCGCEASGMAHIPHLFFESVVYIYEIHHFRRLPEIKRLKRVLRHHTFNSTLRLSSAELR